MGTSIQKIILSTVLVGDGGAVSVITSASGYTRQEYGQNVNMSVAYGLYYRNKNRAAVGERPVPTNQSFVYPSLSVSTARLPACAGRWANG